MKYRFVAGISGIFVVTGLMACASQNPQGSAAKTTAAPMAAVIAPAPAAAPATAATPADAAATDAKTRQRGYRKEMRDGVEYFCKRSVVTGSRLQQKEACYTEEDLRKQTEANQQAAQDMQNPITDGIAINTGF